MTIIASFERFQYFNFERDFLEYENLFQKTGVCFLTGSTKIQNVISVQNCQCFFAYQKPMLRQIEWKVQNGPITKNGGLPVTTFTFLKILLQFKRLL